MHLLGEFLVSILRFIGGIVYFFILPGVLLKISYFKKVPMLLSPILGLLLQVYNMFSLWIVYIVLGKQPLNIALLLTLITLGEIVSLVLLISSKHSSKYYIKYYRNFLKFSSVDKYLMISIAIYLLLALYWQRFATEPHSDGAIYLDIARNIVEKGVFQSNIILLPNDWRYVIFSTGFSYDIHSVGYFCFAVFFTFGGVSLQIAQIALIFQGMLIILILFELCKKVFNVNIARLSAIILSIHPEFITHVVLVGGPEIPSILFLLLTYYMIVLSIEDKQNCLKYSVIGAFSMFLTWFSWYFNFYIFFAQIPFLYLYVSHKNSDFKVRNFAAILMLLAYFIFDYRIIENLPYLYLKHPFPIALIVFFFLLRTNVLKKMSFSLKLFFTFILSILSLFSIYAVVFQSSPTHRQYHSQLSEPSAFLKLQAQRDLKILFTRPFNLEYVNNYYQMYREGFESYIGSLLIVLSILSIIRFRLIKEILLFWTFPLFHFLLWILFSTIEVLQARYLLSCFIFYVILTAISLQTFIPMTKRRSIKLIIRTFIPTASIKLIIRTFIPMARRDSIKLITLLILLLSISYSIYNLYPNFEQILNSWKYSENFGWTPAINWIKKFIPQDAVLLTRSSSYFAWYTGRRVAHLDIGFNVFPTDQISEPQLVDLIRLYKANYLIIERRTTWIFPYLSSLLVHHTSFLGANIVFKDNNVVIYNVTNIAYGSPRSVAIYTLHDMETLNYWYPNLYYGNAFLSLDNEIKKNGNYSIKFTQFLASGRTQACIFLSENHFMNLSDYDYLSFYVKSLHNCSVIVALITDPYNYFITPKISITSGNFSHVLVSIKVLRSVGRPLLSNITRIQVCFGDLSVNKSYTFWIDGPLLLEKITYDYP
ncbi:MAG: glycosyltransferase family 39 protein [Thermofilum sp.]|nr:glycosyltransferase family 39 protein [Thermofilum sp.]